MKKHLLITHTDLDGISPIILLSLANIKFEYKTIEIGEVDETFDDLLKKDLSNYEMIYVTDLTLTPHVYDLINNTNINVKVFDHHETHLFANAYDYVNVSIALDGIQTCATELFYHYLKELYPALKRAIVADYVKQVRELDTYNFTSDLPHHLEFLKKTYGKVDFIKSIVKRLKKDKDCFELTAFEKRFVKLKAQELERYLISKEKKMKTYEIENRRTGIVFAENSKSELGHYLSEKHPELDLIILIDISSRISYRTERDDISVSEFASIFGGGGHKQASGSQLTDDDRHHFIEYYYKNVKIIELDENI